MSGICRRVCRARSWNPSIMSAQAAGVLGVGTDPPPDRSEPRFAEAMSSWRINALRGRGPSVVRSQADVGASAVVAQQRAHGVGAVVGVVPMHRRLALREMA